MNECKHIERKRYRKDVKRFPRHWRIAIKTFNATSTVVQLCWDKESWANKVGRKVSDFVFTRHRQGFRFHLATFKNRFQRVRVTFSSNFDAISCERKGVLRLFSAVFNSLRTPVKTARRLTQLASVTGSNGYLSPQQHYNNSLGVRLKLQCLVGLKMLRNIQCHSYICKYDLFQWFMKKSLFTWTRVGNIFQMVRFMDS